MTLHSTFFAETCKPIPLIADARQFHPRLPLLITGIAGVAGYNALRYFQRRYPGRVIGIRPRRTWKLVGDGIVALDAEDRTGMAALFDAHRFRSVLNCLGNCALKKCELDAHMAHQLNVESVRCIVENVRRYDCRLVHLSTDLVFSGENPQRPYLETDAVDPVTVYGKTMVRGEAIVRNEAPRAAILRISLPMGASFNRHAGAVDWIDSRFRNGRPATLYFDEVRSCTYCDDLNRVFERTLLGDEPGTYHCGGERPVTLYQMGQIINRTGGYASQLLKGCPRIEAGPMPPRAGNVAMDSGALMRLLGVNPFRRWPLHLTELPAGRGWHAERSGDESGTFAHIERQLYRYD